MVTLRYVVLVVGSMYMGSVSALWRASWSRLSPNLNPEIAVRARALGGQALQAAKKAVGEAAERQIQPFVQGKPRVSTAVQAPAQFSEQIDPYVQPLRTELYNTYMSQGLSGVFDRLSYTRIPPVYLAGLASFAAAARVNK